MTKVGEGTLCGGMCLPQALGEGFFFFLNQGGILKAQGLTNICIVFFTWQSAIIHLVLGASHVN